MSLKKISHVIKKKILSLSNIKSLLAEQISYTFYQFTNREDVTSVVFFLFQCNFFILLHFFLLFTRCSKIIEYKVLRLDAMSFIQLLLRIIYLSEKVQMYSTKKLDKELRLNRVSFKLFKNLLCSPLGLVP